MKKVIILFFLLLTQSTFAQLKGVIYGHGENNKKEPIYRAKVRSIKTNEGTFSNEDGTFELILGKNFPDTLVFSAMGYDNDTLIVTKKDRFALIEINLYSDLLLPELRVIAKKEGHGIMKLKTLNVEYIGEGELRKAACCNLSESFETNASVDVNMTDAISGTKKIQMMGLDGVYTQIQMENIPYLRGLESSYGMSAIPGTWIESIQITKGTGNVVNGYESMAGLINLELKKPENMERFFFNTYVSRFGRAEINLHGGGKVNEKWKVANFAHAAGMFGEIDENKDGFRDLPQTRNLSFLNRWRYDGKRMESQLGINGYYEEKTGGQNGYQRSNTSGLYGVFIQNKHLDAFAKTGFLFEKKPYQSIGIVYQLKYQETKALYGIRQFEGSEMRGYVNAIFDGIIGNTNHKIKSGLSMVYADITQQLDSIKIPRLEMVPGAFGEYTYSGTRFTGIIGVRGDYHNLYGFQLTPRMHGRFAINEKLDFRFSGGRGFRVANVLIDNISLLATSRQWVVDPVIQPEVSWNFGGSLVQEFKFRGQKASLTTDYYYTFFENQLVVDRDQSLEHIYFTNLQGTSYSHAFQTELSLPISKTLEWRIAFKYLDVKTRLGGKVQQQVMIPQYRGISNIAWKSRNKRWEYDLTATLYGKSRLHPAHHVDGTTHPVEESPVFVLVNTQLTYVYHAWDYYLGVENLGNYTQKDPIIGANDPFGSNFDATRIYAPVQATNVYLGVRFKLKKQNAKK